MSTFKLTSQFKPTGDQPKAIKALCRNILDGKRHNVLLGVTGSGKTFTMAHVIAKVNKPTLVIAPNKTLAAQLYNEFKHLFPENAVEYFVSYYDYYQPEAYIPSTDLYIEKETDINDEIDKLRHSATMSLFTRRDVIIVASVSCIYSLGAPEEYHSFALTIEKDKHFKRDKLVHRFRRCAGAGPARRATAPGPRSAPRSRTCRTQTAAAPGAPPAPPTAPW